MFLGISNMYLFKLFQIISSEKNLNAPSHSFYLDILSSSFDFGISWDHQPHYTEQKRAYFWYIMLIFH